MANVLVPSKKKTDFSAGSIITLTLKIIVSVLVLVAFLDYIPLTDRPPEREKFGKKVCKNYFIFGFGFFIPVIVCGILIGLERKHDASRVTEI